MFNKSIGVVMKNISTFCIYILLCAFLSISTNNLYSQTIRKVLVEEGTNTSCGPCASQNPTFQAWIANNINRLVPVVYHPWWPSPQDPFYLYDTAMAATRIRYYGIQNIGVPCGVLNGQFNTPTGSNYQGCVSDTVAWANGLAAEEFYSPIKITIQLTQNNGSGTVKVDVSSSAKLSNKKLRVVICEQYHQYNAANGEKEFYYLARKMLPDFNGTDISLSAGETKSFTYDFSVDPTFVPGGLYAAAFIQDDDTKEVLQAESSLNYPAPKEPDYSVFVNQFDNVFVGNKGDSSSMDIILMNTTGSDVTYMLNAFTSSQTPADWTATVVDNKYVVQVKANSTEEVKLNFTIGNTTGIGEVNINALIQGKSISFNTSKLIGISESIDALHVMGGASDQSVFPIITAKRGTGKYFDISSQNFSLAYPMLANLKTFVWDGSTDGEFTANDATSINDAMNKGIGVLLCGGKITTGLVNYGVLNQFNSSFIAYSREGYGSSPWPVTLAGITGDLISFDFGNNVSGHLINWLLPLFKINNASTTFPVMTFAASKDSIFAIRVQKSNSRAVLLGINPFVILDTTIRSNLINRSLDWIEYKINDVKDGEDFQAIKDAYATPNPFTDKITLHFNFTNMKINGNLNISVVNEIGQTVKVLNERTYNLGENNLVIDLSNLCAGDYFIQILSGSQSLIVPIVKVQ